jgi:hypothetical protein
MRSAFALLAALLLATTLTSQAVYFYLSDTTKSCFVQEGTLLVLQCHTIATFFLVFCPDSPIFPTAHINSRPVGAGFSSPAVPEETAVLVKYANIDHDHLGPGTDGHPASIEITVFDPEKQLVSRHDANPKGRIAWVRGNAASRSSPPHSFTQNVAEIINFVCLIPD